MYIEELEDENVTNHSNNNLVLDVSKKSVLQSSAKRLLIGAGARFLFYPTLLYNVFRNKIQTEFRWWDEVDKFVLLGAVPFPGDVPCLKRLGVQGNASCGKMTYVHCKAGRGRSTTIVLCYLIQHKHMTPRQAYEHVRSIRPRVLLASCQWKAVQDYYKAVVENKKRDADEQQQPMVPENSLPLVPKFPIDPSTLLDDASIVLITESDLDGYNDSIGGGGGLVRNANYADGGSFVCRVQFAGQAALTRLSCMWLGSSHSRAKVGSKKMGLVQSAAVKGMEGGCSPAGTGGADKLSGRSLVDIPVF